MTRLTLIIGVLLLSTGSGTAQVKAVAKACATDIKSQCSDVKPGEGRIKACTMQHAQSVSPQCKQAILFEKAESR